MAQNDNEMYQLLLKVKSEVISIYTDPEAVSIELYDSTQPKLIMKISLFHY